MEHYHGMDNETRDTLFIIGGAAMIVFGAGLILSTPAIRKYLGNGGIGQLLTSGLPDLQRYMRLKSM